MCSILRGWIKYKWDGGRPIINFGDFVSQVGIISCWYCCDSVFHSACCQRSPIHLCHYLLQTLFGCHIKLTASCDDNGALDSVSAHKNLTNITTDTFTFVSTTSQPQSQTSVTTENYRNDQWNVTEDLISGITNAVSIENAALQV